jgi:hypothetical protein
MVESDRHLNQALEKLLVFRWRSTPDVFEGLVSVEELGVVKQANSAYVLVGIHPSFWHRADGTEG